MIKTVAVLACLLAVTSAGFLPLDYYAHPLVVHKPLASSYSYFHKVDHSVPVVKTVISPVVHAPLVYKPLPLYHGLHYDHAFHHF